MGVNQVRYGDTTIMDITDSTVNSNNLLSGEIAYDAAGDKIVGAVDLNSKVNNISIAPVEDSPSTSQHRVGDEFIWNGTLYEVISPIEIGDELVIGTNIRIDDDILSKIQANSDFSIIEVKSNCIYIIPNHRKVRVANLTFKTKTSTKVQIHVEVNLESTADAPSGEISSFSDIWAAIASSAVKGKFSYVLNENEITEIYPTETWIDGEHIVHLMYVLDVSNPNTLNRFEVFLEATNGSILIGQGGAKASLLGSGVTYVIASERRYEEDGETSRRLEDGTIRLTEGE